MPRKRTDIHSPARIITEDYVFVGLLPTQSFAGEHQHIEDHMTATGGTWAKHKHGGTCHVCGSSAMNHAVFLHTPTNEYIMTGETCADYFDDVDSAGFRRMKKQVKDNREFQAGLARRKALLEDRGLVHALECEHGIVLDLLGKLRNYGDLSEKQWEFLASLVKQEEERPQREAQYAAEKEAASPIPEFDGRVTVEMTVVSIKEPDESAMYPVQKLVLKHSDGWVLYGSLPSALWEVKRGDKVRMTLRVEVSKDDPKFGFYSRPTKASITKKGGE